MKRLHRPDLFAWSHFDEARDIDFNSVAWIRAGGNVLIDPLPMSEHERSHLDKLGGAAIVIVTNSDHTRAAAELASALGAMLYGPGAERVGFPIACERWLADGDEAVPGLLALEMNGGKTPGELALVLEDTTLITGDLVRGQIAGRLNLLPDSKLSDRAQAVASVRRVVAGHPRIETVLVGDGWSVFGNGARALAALCEEG